MTAAAVGPQWWRDSGLIAPTRWRGRTVFAVVFVCYALLALSAYELFGAQTIGVTFFPPAGLTYAAFLLLPRRHWPAVALAIVLGEVVVDVGEGNGLWFSLGWAAANLAEPFVGAMVTRRVCPRPEFDRRTAVAFVVGGLAIGPMVGAAIGAAVLTVAMDEEWLSSFADVWVGDALGVLVVAPLFLVVARGRSTRVEPGDRREAILIAGALVVSAVVIFATDSVAVGYALIPLLAWAALRFGPAGLAVVAVAVASITTAATARGHGPWAALPDADANTQLGVQQAFLLAAIGGSWLLALEVRERIAAVDTAKSVASEAALLARALHSGQMGVWTWDQRTNRVEWDRNLEQLFGLPAGGFGGTFDSWIELLHPDDHGRVLREMQAGVDAKSVFRVEHRCVWPDGSVHWMEGIGEVVLDPGGEVVGAFGVGANIDERRRAEDERQRLFEIERAARQRSEFLGRVNEALSSSLDLPELVELVTAAAVPALGDWCSLILTVDQPPEKPITATAHADPNTVVWARLHNERFPFDPTARLGAAQVIRTGKTSYMSHIEDDLIDLYVEDEEHRTIIKNLDVQSSIIVALPGQLGILGALEIVRTSASPPYTEAMVSMAEDLARSIGAALNNAMLYRRQHRARRALDTLQRFTGILSEALTSDDIVQAVVNEGREGVAADSAMLYLFDEGRMLRLAASSGVEQASVDPWLVIDPAVTAPVTDAIRTRAPIVLSDRDEKLQRYPTLDDAGRATAVVALPLAIGNQVLGALAFTFARPRRVLDEELAMLQSLASRCAGAIDRARLYEQQRAVSLMLQRRLLPALPPLPPWLEAGACYLPATGGEVGGDWYQMMVLEGGGCVAALGDAVGRGLAAAAAMGQLRAVIAGAANVDPDPVSVIAATDAFAQGGADTRCASLAYVLIDEAACEMRYASAGHLPPVLIKADGTTGLLQGGRSPLLGSVAKRGATEVAISDFGVGDTLILYSDGLVERRTESIEASLERLRGAAKRLCGLPPAELGDALVQELTGGNAVRDDIAVLVLRRAGTMPMW